MLISSGVSNTFLFAPAPYHKLNKGFFLGFLFKPLGGLCPPCGLNKKASEKYPLLITCSAYDNFTLNSIFRPKAFKAKFELRVKLSYVFYIVPYGI